MCSDVKARRGREGFTLVEVLVAMVILAIGLLALEALGIGAARAVAAADARSEYTSLATAQMEETLARVRGNLPAGVGIQTVGNVTLTTAVAQVPVGGRQMFTVTVTATPTANPRSRLNIQPVIVVGREIR